MVLLSLMELCGSRLGQNSTLQTAVYQSPRPDSVHDCDCRRRIYDDFSRLLFLHTHREASALDNEIQEESEQFRFLRAACYANIKGSVGLILAKASVMRISIPLDLSSRSFIPLPRFMRPRRAAPL
jgi:hypothetical protein